MQFTTTRKSTAAWCLIAVWVVWALRLRGQLLVMLVTAAFYSVGLSMFELDLALPVGLFASLALFISCVDFGIGLHPLAVIFALLALAQLFDFVGILIALPASAVLLPGLRRGRAGYLTRRPYQDRAA